MGAKIDKGNIEKAVAVVLKHGRQIQEIELKYADRLASLEEKMMKLRAEMDAQIEPISEKRKKIQEGIEGYVAAMGLTTTLLTTGEIYVQVTKFLECEDEVKTLGLLKKDGKTNFIRIKESLDKTALRKLDEKEMKKYKLAMGERKHVTVKSIVKK